jgi:biotin transporter BioY
MLLGPTGGYIIGMVLCVCLITTLREKYGEKSWMRLVGYSLLGQCMIYMIGLLQLSVFVGAARVLELGLYPFIIPGIVKTMFTASSVRLLKNISR